MRRTLWATTASTLAASLVIGLSACSDSTTPSGGAEISASETNDIGEAVADEVDQSVGSLTAEGAASGEASAQSAVAYSVVGLTLRGAGCATVSSSVDTDGDFAPDLATFTFALPACHFTGFRGGTLDITGSVDLTDPTPNDYDFAFQATLHDLTFVFTGPQGKSYTAVRNGSRVLTGDANGLVLTNNITVNRTFPVRAPASVTHDLVLTFTPDQGSTIILGQPLPSGTFVKAGTFTWSRGNVTRTFTVTTVAPLVWDSSCTTDRKIASGEIHATLSDGSYVKTVWNGCGVDPVRTFVPASS